MPSISKKQQRFFGMIHGANKKGKKLKGAAGKAQRSMSKKQVKDFTVLKDNLDFLEVYNYVIISEGYKDVRNRITSILTSKIPNFDPDKVRISFSKHQKNKDRLPEEFRNIDTYFSKKFDNDIVSRYNNLENELNKIPNIRITKGEAKKSLYNSLKLAENDEYILFKVPSHEDAVKLVRPGNAVPNGCDWPAMLPVSWCITADSEGGQHMWDIYAECEDYKDEDKIPNIIKFDNNGVYFAPIYEGSNFCFAFRKHLLNDPKDFLAIRMFPDGNFEITQTPNSPPEPLLKTWPDELPLNWQSFYIPHGDTIPQFAFYNELDNDQWIEALIKYPQLIEYFEEYNDWKKLDGYNWIKLLINQPRFEDKCNEYDGWRKFNRADWEYLLSKRPQFEDKCSEYNGWEKLIGYEWALLLSEHPQFAKYCDKYNGWKEFINWQWARLLEFQPQFKDTARKYGYNFNKDK